MMEPWTGAIDRLLRLLPGRGLVPWRTVAATTVAACGLLGAGAGPAAASGIVTGFAVTPASTQAASNPNVSEDITFSSGALPAPAADSVKDVTFTLAPGLMGSVANVPATCSSAQLTANTCPAGSQIGSGVVTLNGSDHENASVYLMPAPSAGDVAGVGEVIEGTSVRGTGAFDITTDSGGQQVVEIRLGIPQVSGEHVTEIVATINGTTADGKPLTRLPSSCSPATTSVSVDAYDGSTGSGASTFTPTGCSSLSYAPSLSTVQVIRDASDAGAEIVFSASQPGAATESATTALSFDTSSTLSLNGSVDASCLTGSPCVIGTASATSPLVASSYLSNGTVTLGGSSATPSLTIAFPAPASLTLNGAINPATGAITFPNDPDVPLTGLALDITGPAGGKAFNTTCAAGSAIAAFTPQDGGADVTSAQPIAYQNCPTPSPSPNPTPSPNHYPSPNPSPRHPPIITPKPPVVSASVAGLRTGHPTLRLMVTRGAHGASITSVAIRAPSGFSFRTCEKSPKHRICEGLAVSGGTVRVVKLRGGRVVITFAKPVSQLSLAVTQPLLIETSALTARARKHEAANVTVTITVVDSNDSTTTRTLRLKT